MRERNNWSRLRSKLDEKEICVSMTYNRIVCSLPYLLDVQLNDMARGEGEAVEKIDESEDQVFESRHKDEVAVHESEAKEA